jgi:hypothetical protein
MSSDFGTGEAVVCSDQEISGTIARGLHQATQPLTVLQGMLELALLQASTVDQFKGAIEQSLGELQRVVDSFEHLRTLAQLQQPASDITTFSASSMVETVLDSLQGHSVSAGVKLALQVKLDGREGSGEDCVRMSRSRISTALKMALSDLLPFLKRGSQIVVLITAEAGEVLIRVQTADPIQQRAAVPDAPPSLTTPRQEVARAMAASTGAQLTFFFCPSGLLIRLPRLALSGVCGEVEQRKAEVAHV